MSRAGFGIAIGVAVTSAIACGGGSSSGSGRHSGGGSGAAPGGGGGSGGINVGGSANGGSGGLVGGSGGFVGGSGGADSGTDGQAASGGTGGTSGPIPITCEEAAVAQSHFGCEFWPTVVPNMVWQIFDFAVIVANPGTQSADVSVQRGSTTVATEKINGKSSKIIYLPWVPNLKGPDANNCGDVLTSGASVRETGGAYRLTSTAPVAVFQHSPVESHALGGPPNKSWSACPGDQNCSLSGKPLGCDSNTTDSVLLLPTSSLGTTYRAAGFAGWQVADVGPYLAITGTQNTTKVSVSVALAGGVKAGGGIPDKTGGSAFDVFLDQGDVIVLQGPPTANLAGSLLSADKPVQVISGMTCVQVPNGQESCDHLEEALMPAPSLGKHYLVPVPRGPKGDTPGHVVQFVGHIDGTALSYLGAAPPGAPASINAGQVVELGLVTQSFEVQGTHGFSVVSYLAGADVVDPNTPIPNGQGDPSMRLIVPVEQFRSAYAVSLPPNFGSSHIEVVVASGTQLKLDGALVTDAPVAFGSSGYGVVRIGADSSVEVYHQLEADKPFGVQILGYSTYTSYAHPGGASVMTLP